MSLRLAAGTVTAFVVGVAIALGGSHALRGDDPSVAVTPVPPVSSATAETMDQHLNEVVAERTGPRGTAEAFTAAMTTFDATADHSERDAVDRASAYATTDLHTSLLEVLSSEDAPIVWRQLVKQGARSMTDTTIVSSSDGETASHVTVRATQRVTSSEGKDTHQFEFKLTLVKAGGAWLVSEATW